MAKRTQSSSARPRRSTKAAPVARRARIRRRRPTIILVMALTALIAGFLFRRMMLPQAVHYLAYRPPDHPIASPASESTSTENLTDSDRQALDAVARKMK